MTLRDVRWQRIAVAIIGASLVVPILQVLIVVLFSTPKGFGSLIALALPATLLLEGLCWPLLLIVLHWQRGVTVQSGILLGAIVGVVVINAGRLLGEGLGAFLDGVLVLTFSAAAAVTGAISAGAFCIIVGFPVRRISVSAE